MNINETVTLVGQLVQSVTGNRDNGAIAGRRLVVNDGNAVTNSLGSGGYRCDYVTKDPSPLAFDVGHVVLSSCDNPGAKGHFEGEWHVGVSPKDATNSWSYFQQEINIGSYVDAGYRETINANHATGGILVTSSIPGAFGPPGSSQNVTFAFAIAGAAGRPHTAQFYNGIVINPNSLAKGGKGLQANGADSVDNAPSAVIDVTRNWESAIKLERGTYKDDKAITLRAGQKISWSDGTESVHLTPEQISKLNELLAGS